jgi:hypothetical protein
VAERELREEQPAWRRTPSSADPWLGFGVPPPRFEESVRHVPTGELGTQEIAVPLEDGFARGLAEAFGGGRVRDARDDILAAQPDVARAAAFLRAFPAYDAAVWIEVLQARTELPDWSVLTSLAGFASLCSLGLLSWVFLVPVSLDTDVEVETRAYLLLRRTPSEPLAVGVSGKKRIQARGSVGFDVDRFRADVADLAGNMVGQELARELSDRFHHETTRDSHSP